MNQEDHDAIAGIIHKHQFIGNNGEADMTFVNLLADYMNASAKEECRVVHEGGYCFIHKRFDGAAVIAACYGKVTP